jgi:hypothetical protein
VKELNQGGQNNTANGNDLRKCKTTLDFVRRYGVLSQSSEGVRARWTDTYRLGRGVEAKEDQAKAERKAAQKERELPQVVCGFCRQSAALCASIGDGQASQGIPYRVYMKPST